MTFLESLSLGALQGLTEFLPVSSSGHLIILHEFLGGVENTLSFDILVHLATLLAVLVYFRKDILNLLKTFLALIFKREVVEEDKKLFFAIIIGTIPAVLLGLLFGEEFESLFRNSFSVAIALILGSILFILAEKFYRGHQPLNNKKSFWIGCFQALALIPGVSRSGATIAGGFLLGLSREKAVRFSFLLSVPVIFGANIISFLNRGVVEFMSLEILVGFLSAFVFGLLAIHFLIHFLKKHTLSVFVWYRIILALVILFSFY